MKKSRCLLFICLWVLYFFPQQAVGQRSRATLERRKQESLRRIAAAEHILSQTTRTRKVSIGQLSTLNNQIDAHATLVATLSEELQHINGVISGTNQFIFSLEKDLGGLQQEYAYMVFWAYKNRLGINQLTFLLSANSFKQFFLRMKYLSHYAQQRHIQLDAIQKVQRILGFQQKDLRSKRSNQENIFKEKKKRRIQLIKLKKEKEVLVQELNQRSKQLRQDLKEQRASISRLNKLITALIKKEKVSKVNFSPAAYKRISTRFAGSKKKLGWPVQSGVVSSKFGLQQHPIFTSVQQDNIGIEIQTPGSVPVHAIFEGVVSEIALIPGMNSVVILQHGAYRTVYARLSQVFVSKGQKITTKQQIGNVYTNPQGNSSVHFEVWHNTKKLDPETWIVSR